MKSQNLFADLNLFYLLSLAMSFISRNLSSNVFYSLTKLVVSVAPISASCLCEKSWIVISENIRLISSRVFLLDAVLGTTL